ncbi:hypothetical protein LXA43DRAFT_976405 [Ganoderma leucocontextum]|nr:hypothetical protein LXA43DRAFT_976405 [Ganoderma leucocontextum]
MDASIAEATPEEVPITRERDKEFWYEDGNVILVAGNIEFRIFKGILTDHSPVFKDVFSPPQPNSTPSETPVSTVHLSDSPLDIWHILRIHMPKAEPNPFKYKDAGPSFNTISASIRLGHKYQMSSLVGHAIDYLKEHFLTMYDDWEKYPTYGLPAFDDVHAIAVVNFARTFDQPLLLPSTLLACTVLPGRILVAGCKCEDGSHETLAMEDLTRCIHTFSRISYGS